MTNPTSHLTAIVLMGALLAPSKAFAGNSDEVNAGIDVTLTGGAVVANTYTGAALWYNPAGIARIDKSTLEITGITFQTQFVRVPGLLTIGTDPLTESTGKTTNFSVIPEALTFAIVLRENLKLGIGLFNSSLRRGFYTEQVTTAPGISPEATAGGGQNTKLNFYHISAGVAGKLGKNRKQKVLLGGAFDFVVGTARFDSIGTFSWDGGESGLYSDGIVRAETVFGVQLKAGIQWVPIQQLRVGLSIASPTFGFALLQRFAATFAQSPPDGVSLPPDDPNAQDAGSVEVRDKRGGWWGVEPGNLRFGLAFVGAWGWIEGDLVIQWRLQTPELQLDLQRVINGRIGTAFRLTKFIKLGLGAFTDRSPIDQLRVAPLATSDLDFYGVHVGLLFSNREVNPNRAEAEHSKEEGIGLALAIGIRYAYGRGNVLGRFIPAEYDPSSIEPFPTSGTIHELTVNLGAKVLF